MYQIRMKNCAFFARHGVLDEEETLGQRFYVDAELEVNPDSALLSEGSDLLHLGKVEKLSRPAAHRALDGDRANAIRDPARFGTS